MYNLDIDQNFLAQDTTKSVTSPTVIDGVLYIPVGTKEIISHEFSRRMDFYKVVIPMGVTNIGQYAFYGCIYLREVIIPNSVVCIGRYAFNSTLWYDNQPDGLIYVGNTLLRYKGSMAANTHLYIEDGVETIPPYMFKDRWELTEVVIPSSVTNIGEHAFEGCTSLKEVTIPKSVANIGCNAFNNTAWYNDHPDGLIYAGNALCGYKGLPVNTHLRIKEGVETIPPYFFKNCKELARITIPNSVTSIGEHAFDGCTNLKCVKIKNYATSICNYAFAGCTANINFGDIKKQQNVNTRQDEIKIITRPTVIGDTLYIPDGTTEIKNREFQGRNDFTRVIIPDSVTHIGAAAFYNCHNLKNITIGKGVKYVAGDAFKNCESLVGVYINDIASWCSMDFINDESNPLKYAVALYVNGENQTKLVIPDGVAEIKRSVFEYCKCVESISLPDTLIAIGKRSFAWNINLKEVKVPSSVETIADYAFYGCGALKKATISKNLMSVGKSAFKNSGLNEIHFIGAINEWTRMGFAIPKLCSIHGTNFTIIDEILRISSGVTKIKDHEFQFRGDFTKMIIPDGVSSIGLRAFGGCTKLSSIVIPNSVKIIESHAFCDCTNLIEINFDGTKEQWRKIRKSDIWDARTGEYTINCTDGKIVKKDATLCILDGKTKINNCEFLFRDDLTTAIIPDGVLSIGWRAFGGCAKLSSIIIPNSVKFIDSYAFDGCANLVVINFNGTKEQWSGIRKNKKWNSDTGKYIVYCADGNIEKSDDMLKTKIEIQSKQSEPQVVDGTLWILDGQTRIKNREYQSRDDFTRVIIPNGVQSIGWRAFGGCTKLSSIIIPSSIKYIDWHAFEDCTNLIEINFKGSKRQWLGMEKCKNWNSDTGEYTIYCADGKIVKADDI